MKMNKWRVTYENRTEYVYGKELSDAVGVANERVRPEDGELVTVEIYKSGDKFPWKVVLVAPQGVCGI